MPRLSPISSSSSWSTPHGLFQLNSPVPNLHPIIKWFQTTEWPSIILSAANQGVCILQPSKRALNTATLFIFPFNSSFYLASEFLLHLVFSFPLQENTSLPIRTLLPFSSFVLHIMSPPNIHPLPFLLSSCPLQDGFFLVPISLPLQLLSFFIFCLHLFLLCSIIYMPLTTNTFLRTAMMMQSSLSFLHQETRIYLSFLLSLSFQESTLLCSTLFCNLLPSFLVSAFVIIPFSLTLFFTPISFWMQLCWLLFLHVILIVVVLGWTKQSFFQTKMTWNIIQHKYTEPSKHLCISPPQVSLCIIFKYKNENIIQTYYKLTAL
jgi:hypothetical protein